MKWNKLLVTLVGVLALSACASSDKPANIVETILVTPPDYMLTDCEIPKPPRKRDYVNANWEEKENIWSNALANSYSAARKCNTKLRALREWKVEQSKIRGVSTGNNRGVNVKKGPPPNNGGTGLRAPGNRAPSGIGPNSRGPGIGGPNRASSGPSRR